MTYPKFCLLANILMIAIDSWYGNYSLLSSNIV